MRKVYIVIGLSVLISIFFTYLMEKPDFNLCKYLSENDSRKECIKNILFIGSHKINQWLEEQRANIGNPELERNGKNDELKEIYHRASGKLVKELRKLLQKYSLKEKEDFVITDVIFDFPEDWARRAGDYCNNIEAVVEILNRKKLKLLAINEEETFAFKIGDFYFINHYIFPSPGTKYYVEHYDVEGELAKLLKKVDNEISMAFNERDLECINYIYEIGCLGFFPLPMCTPLDNYTRRKFLCGPHRQREKYR